MQPSADLPSGGHWYHTQESMIAELVDGEFAVAWDKNKFGTKYYGRYPDPQTFYSSIRTMKSPCGYELILENSRCKLYADVEWYGERDEVHSMISWIITEIRKHSQELYSTQLEIYVCCSSRELEDGSFKNSYHIVSPSLVFPCNQAIKSFFETLCAGWHGPDPYVDLSVYSKNRCMRLPHCCKKGSQVPFVRISGDPWGTDLDSSFTMDDPESWLPFILKSTSPARKSTSPEQKRKPHSPIDETPTKRRHIESPVPWSKLNDALASSGDKVSTVTNAICVQDKWQIQCDQRKQRRPCLIDKSRTHKSNNCILFLDGKTHRLEYRCMSCKGSNLHLGQFVLVQGDWEFQATAKPDLCYPEHRTYEVVKQEFEEECMKVCDPFIYLRLQKQHCSRSRKPTQMKHVELQQYYAHLMFFEKDKKGDWTKKPFIQAWFKDPKKRQVSSMVVDPQGTLTNVYNLWNGYMAMNESGLAEAFVMGPIVQHLKQVITDDHAEWLLDWMANIVQYPWRKSQVAVCLFGRQGCGKGIIFDWFRERVLGPDHSGQISNPERDLFSRFSDGFLNKTFLQIDEVKSLHDHTDKLKDLITNRTVNWESKNGRTVTVDNFCNFLFTTNNENALRIDSDDRRFVMFRCSGLHTGDRAYFNRLADHLRAPGVDAGFCAYLKKRDLSKYTYDFQAHRPITEYYKESQQASVPPVKRYLSALINQSPENSKSPDNAAEFYSHFKKWCDLEGYKHLTANNAFGREVHRIDGVTSRKSHGKMMYQLDLKTIKKCLRSQGEYDENAILHD